jgi:hypothetical protein
MQFGGSMHKYITVFLFIFIGSGLAGQVVNLEKVMDLTQVGDVYFSLTSEEENYIYFYGTETDSTYMLNTNSLEITDTNGYSQFFSRDGYKFAYIASRTGMVDDSGLYSKKRNSEWTRTLNPDITIYPPVLYYQNGQAFISFGTFGTALHTLNFNEGSVERYRGGFQEVFDISPDKLQVLVLFGPSGELGLHTLGSPGIFTEIGLSGPAISDPKSPQFLTNNLIIFKTGSYNYNKYLIKDLNAETVLEINLYVDNQDIFQIWFSKNKKLALVEMESGRLYLVKTDPLWDLLEEEDLLFKGFETKVSEPTITLWQNPNVNAPVVFSGTISDLTVEVTDQSGAQTDYLTEYTRNYWYKVLLSNGEEGWIHGDFVEIEEEERG